MRCLNDTFIVRPIEASTVRGTVVPPRHYWEEKSILTHFTAKSRTKEGAAPHVLSPASVISETR
jgi:hypothetical protein